MDGMKMRRIEGSSSQPMAEILTAVRDINTSDEKRINVHVDDQGEVGSCELQATEKGSSQGKYLSNENLVERPTSSFLALPAEIRNLIYGFGLCAADGQVSPLTTSALPSCLDLSYFMTRKRPGQSGLSPSLTAVNHQVFAETRAMLHGQPLRFGSCHALDLFLKQIGGRNRVLLQDITVSGWVFSGWEFWWTGGEAMMKQEI